MFHDITQPVLSRMRELERLDAMDRENATPKVKRLRQIPPETGMFIAMLAAGSPSGATVEIGTSAGYSALWLSLARKSPGAKIVTFEVMPEKAALARETFRLAGVEDRVDLVTGDARAHLAHFDRIAFCFLDAEKDVYGECYDAVAARLVPGGLLVADNVISHREELAPFVEMVRRDRRVDALVVPIGSGELVCRRI